MDHISRCLEMAHKAEFVFMAQFSPQYQIIYDIKNDEFVSACPLEPSWVDDPDMPTAVAIADGSEDIDEDELYRRAANRSDEIEELVRDWRFRHPKEVW